MNTETGNSLNSIFNLLDITRYLMMKPLCSTFKIIFRYGISVHYFPEGILNSMTKMQTLTINIQFILSFPFGLWDLYWGLSKVIITSHNCPHKLSTPESLHSTSTPYRKYTSLRLQLWMFMKTYLASKILNSCQVLRNNKDASIAILPQPNDITKKALNGKTIKLLSSYHQLQSIDYKKSNQLYYQVIETTE